MENHLTRSSRDVWRGAGLVEKRLHRDHERRVDGQVMGYISHGVGEVRVIQPRDQSWSVKPLSQPLYPLDANEVEPVPRRTRGCPEDPPPLPPQTVNELMDCTLKDYEEDCVEEGTVPSELTREAGEWEDQELDQMETNLNEHLYEACPFHPHQFIQRRRASRHPRCERRNPSNKRLAWPLWNWRGPFPTLPSKCVFIPNNRPSIP